MTADDSPTANPMPEPTADTEAYWEACARQSLQMQQCGSCSKYQFPPRMLCSHCGCLEVHWRRLRGEGLVYSRTVIWRAPSAAFAEDVPYVVALVDLAEGPRLMTNIVNCDPHEVYIGMPVRCTFLPRGRISLPVFEPDRASQLDREDQQHAH
jgi:uncharacterized OB-fold protein